MATAFQFRAVELLSGANSHTMDAAGPTVTLWTQRGQQSHYGRSGAMSLLFVRPGPGHGPAQAEQGLDCEGRSVHLRATSSWRGERS